MLLDGFLRIYRSLEEFIRRIKEWKWQPEGSDADVSQYFPCRSTISQP